MSKAKESDISDSISMILSLISARSSKFAFQKQGCRFDPESKPNPGNQYLDA